MARKINSREYFITYDSQADCGRVSFSYQEIPFYDKINTYIKYIALLIESFQEKMNRHSFNMARISNDILLINKVGIFGQYKIMEQDGKVALYRIDDIGRVDNRRCKVTPKMI